MTLTELHEFLEKKHKSEPLFPGEDSWVAIVRPEHPEWHDFVQVGSAPNGHALGISHTDSFGAPGWADDENP